MPASRQRHALVALVFFTAAAGAGWFTVTPPTADSARVLSAFGEKTTSPGVTSQPADKSPSAMLAAAERAFVLEVDPPDERCTGERLAELCLADATDLPGEGMAGQYARRWAMKSPQEMYDWFQSRGGFEFPTDAQRNRYRSFDSVLFTEWAKRDPAAAMKAALACNHKLNRGPAVMMIIGTVHKTDPQRAFALAAKHMEFFRGGPAGGSK